MKYEERRLTFLFNGRRKTMRPNEMLSYAYTCFNIVYSQRKLRKLQEGMEQKKSRGYDFFQTVKAFNE